MSFPRYPKYKDSGVEWLGQVPEHWRVVPLGRITTSRCDGPFGSGLKSEHYAECGVRVIRLQNIRRDGFDGRDEVFVDYDYYQRELGGHGIESGDVLIAGLGDDNNTVGRACVAPTGIEPAMVKADCFRFRLDTDQSLPRFVAAALCGSAEAGAGTLSSGSTRSRIALSQMASRKLALPPLPEQIAIAAFLDRETTKTDALMAEQERLIELLKEKRQAVISHAITKGLTPDVPMKNSGVEWLGEIPSHWEWAALLRIGSRVVVGIAEAATHAYADEGVPILRSTNIRAGRIIGEILFVDPVFASERGTKRLYAGDLVSVRTGNAGVTATIPAHLDGCQCFTMLITTLNAGSVSEYYCYWMNSASAQCYFSLEGWGTAQVNISVPILKSLPVPLPPQAEQQAIVAALDRETAKIDALTTEAQRAIDLLQERRTALVSAAVTGQIDVRKVAGRAA